jgi:hypothetical protein
MSRAADAAFASALERDPERRPDRVEPWADAFAAALETCPPSVTGWPDLFAPPPRPGRGDPWTQTSPNLRR